MALSRIASFVSTSFGGLLQEETSALTASEAARQIELSRHCSLKTSKRFGKILTRLNLNSAIALALTARGGARHCTSSSLTCTILQPPFNGVYNIVYRVKFSDGVTWALKIPRCGHAAEWTSVSRRALETEAEVMKLLKRQTTIPVPEVFAVDSNIDGNPLGCPYILMSWIEGISLSNYWDKNASHPGQLDLEQRITLLNDLASAVRQLDQFEFNSCGVPIFEEGDIAAIGPMIMKDCTGGNIEDETPLREVGPFKNGHDLLVWSIDRFASQSSDPGDTASQELFHLLLSWVQETVKTPERFVLAHRDLGPQNILVTDKGQLCGIIDWDMAAIVPKYLGNGTGGTYPHWLTRDMDLWDNVSTVASIHSRLELEMMSDNMSGCRKLDAVTVGAGDVDDDFYRTVWRRCLRDGVACTVPELIKVVPRTYAQGLTVSHSIDARLLMVAAEHPQVNLGPMVNNIRSRLEQFQVVQPRALDPCVLFDGVTTYQLEETSINDTESGSSEWGRAGTLNFAMLLTTLDASLKTPPNSPCLSRSSLDGLEVLSMQDGITADNRQKEERFDLEIIDESLKSLLEFDVERLKPIFMYLFAGKYPSSA